MLFTFSSFGRRETFQLILVSHCHISINVDFFSFDHFQCFWSYHMLQSYLSVVSMCALHFHLLTCLYHRNVSTFSFMDHSYGTVSKNSVLNSWSFVWDNLRYSDSVQYSIHNTVYVWALIVILLTCEGLSQIWNLAKTYEGKNQSLGCNCGCLTRSRILRLPRKILPSWNLKIFF